MLTGWPVGTPSTSGSWGRGSPTKTRCGRRTPVPPSPFGEEHWESPHLGPSGWGINFRVDDLDALVGQLREADLEVEVDPELYPNGRFAQLLDPEGNPVQLWEPMG